MSIDFWVKPYLQMKELFDGRLKNWVFSNRE
jgi:hypothetical protein